MPNTFLLGNVKFRQHESQPNFDWPICSENDFFLFKQFNWFLKVEYYIEACFQILILKSTAFLLNFLNIIWSSFDDWECWIYPYVSLLWVVFCIRNRLTQRLSSKEPACHAGDVGWLPELGRSSGEGNGNPLQDSCLGNPMDREESDGLQSMGLQMRWTWFND